MYALFVAACAICATTRADFWAERDDLLTKERSQYLGSDEQLSDSEQIFNEKLSELKQSELEYGFKNPEDFVPIQHFFEAKNKLQNSTVYKIIQSLPKGSVLHIHDTAILRPEWIVPKVTYRENLYIQLKSDDSIEFLFTKNPPNNSWQLLNDLRRQSGNEAKFDRWLASKLTLIVPDPSVYKDINVVWKAFNKIFSTSVPLLTYTEVFKDYLYEVFRTYYQDNVSYMEMRSTLPPLYEMNGRILDVLEIVGVLKEVNDQFVKDYGADFVGMRLIYSPVRLTNNDTLKKELKIYKEIKVRMLQKILILNMLCIMNFIMTKFTKVFYN